MPATLIQDVPDQETLLCFAFESTSVTNKSTVNHRHQPCEQFRPRIKIRFLSTTTPAVNYHHQTSATKRFSTLFFTTRNCFLHMPPKRRHMASTSNTIVSCRSRRSRRSSLLDDIPALPFYYDCGNCTCVCEYCGAFFWYQERVLYLSRANHPRYTKCCKSGNVVLPYPLRPPNVLMQFYEDDHFMNNIRAYNSMFSMTSFGANEDDSINKGRAPYVFKVSGQIYHWIGSFYPQDVHPPRFLQLYMCDTENEVANRLHSFHGEGKVLLSADVVDSLSHMLHTHNEYVRTFKTAKEIAQSMNLDSYGVRLFNVVPDRRYGPPAPGSLGCIVCGDDVTGAMYDIVVYSKIGSPQRVSKLHPTYMPLQYPLLFPYGEEGWSPALNLRINSNRSLTNNMYYSYQIHDRHTYSLILRSRRLFHQYLVDAYTCIEQSRLDFIEHHQQQLRIEYINGVYDALSKGDTDSRVIGKRVFLPATFVGGPRYMYKHYQDALAICKVHGKPQYFITFTCNVKWPEYRRYMDDIGQRDIQNRPDIIARIFKIKVHAFINFLKEDKTFGDVNAYLYTIEFQKRGLPHCHTLLWVTSPFRVQEGADIDKYITAELPDPILEPALYRTVTTCMIHGPCGSLNIGAPCMVDGKCMKRFPKPFNPLTTFDENGYMHYRRRDGSYHVLQSGVRTDNGFVVPYNKRLCSRFDAHINVEYCGWNMMIKYLFKYISKGVDRVRFTLQTLEANTTASSSTIPVVVNEIKSFLDGRYICPHEATWRILNFPIHERDPPVQVLAVHLEGMQTTVFKENSQLGSLIDTPGFGVTTLTEWLHNNQHDVRGIDLTYNDYPSKYIWDTNDKRWIHRTTTTNTTIGRLAYVHPTAGELFYLRILLFHQKGCKSFYDIRTVRENIYSTFRDACEALGLTGDDKEWLTAFEEASSWATSSELRSLFCHLLLYCEVGNPLLLWEVAKPKMGDDIAYTLTTNSTDPNVILRVDTLEQQILLEIQKTLLASTPSKSLADFGLPMPCPSLLSILKNRLLLEETNYDTNLLISQNSSMVSQLNPDQLTIYERVVDAERNKNQLLLFVYGSGGTGKTFLWTTILSYFRSKGKIILAVAASGIASLLLPLGRTAHSRFVIPIDFTDKSSCNIKKKTQLAELLKRTSMIIWDEAPMSDRRCFEFLDRSLKDVLEDDNHLFGGMSILLGGDFRQTLPVQPKSRKSQIISLTLPNSYLWSHFTVFKLHQNMRLAQPVNSNMDVNRISQFASWLLDIGNGNIRTPDKNDLENTNIIQIPHCFLIESGDKGLESLIHFVYGKDIISNPSPEELSVRAIICPKNETADQVNDLILSKTNSQEVVYNSCDSIKSQTHDSLELDTLYPQDYLNNLHFSGIPSHRLILKVNTPVMLMRNINQREGLCNGTRLIVTQLLPSVIEASIITGISVGKRVYIPRIKFVHNTSDLPFIFIRKQFPIKVCYAMTINKSQGQSLKKVGLYLTNSVFTHGQLYVALSRATSPDSIKILLQQEEALPFNCTRNVVFKDLLAKVNMQEITCNINNIFFLICKAISSYMDRISNLQFGSPGNSLEIRVLRKWTLQFRKDETWFIVIDKHGDTIQLLAQKTNQGCIETSLVVSRCYRIKDYTCTEPDKYQKVLNYPVHMNIGEASTIEEIPNHNALPLTWFSFSPRSHFQIIADKNLEHPDFIGVLIDMKDRTKKNKEPFIVITLTDENAEEITILLWKECIDMPGKFNRNALTSNSNTVVLAFTNVKSTMYNGRLTLTSTSATHMYVNPKIPETDKLITRYGTQFHSKSTATVINTTLQRLKTSNFSQIVDKIYVLKTTLSDFTFKDEWYHVPCTTCGKSTHKKGDGWFCVSHGPINEPKLFYKISAVLEDNTDTTTVFMSNEATQTLVNASAQEIIDRFPSQDRKTLPQPLERCKGLTKNVYVECTKLSSTKNIRFTVTTITDIKTLQPIEQQTTPSTPIKQQTATMESLTPTKSCETGKRLQMEHTETPKKPRSKREKYKCHGEADEGTHPKKQ
ncbi:unnamed protein product [Lactuca saligna]|uniref:ATP-dependent DNA helicase n=1 Tax=Lactuca saligna TaxID=75948 RepID=A0AA36EPK2_LACSI|nr:unnamed protein product [Lactuca saligna]